MDYSLSILSWTMFFAICLLGEVQLKIHKQTVRSFLTREKCIPELGCFSAAAPFFDLLERPLSMLPDDREQINATFLLFTQKNPNSSMEFSNMAGSSDNLSSSGFDPKLKTKVIIPGYISEFSYWWKMPLKDALLHSTPCNVFYVDWSGGDGFLYEQAVANARVVGAEIALLIHQLQERKGIKPESVHLIGHSLGSHIAGYAGKRISNLGRITALDPAGPYFIGVDPAVRLDRSDALLVDVIHTNAGTSRFTGLGLQESIGHFDFFPNGGHLQPGCKDMGPAFFEFLTHLSLEPSAIQNLICSHIRAIDLFLSSIIQDECKLLGALCDNWDEFVEGKCGTCDEDSSSCVPLGLQADRYAKLIDRKRSLNFYLNTTDSEPFCLK